MADIIDPARHADLIALQRQVDAAWAALTGYRQEVGKPGIDWTEVERARWQVLQDAVIAAAAARDAGLRDSGLVEEHDFYQADQALKQAAKPTAGA